jgi:hypothetical protein
MTRRQLPISNSDSKAELRPTELTDADLREVAGGFVALESMLADLFHTSKTFAEGAKVNG